MPPEQKEEDFEVIDTEEYRSPEDQEFSHQVLVMMATKKVIEYGCGELIPGYYDTQEDGKGRVKIIYKQDTRKAFIESVRSLRMIMICDFDDDAKKILIPNEKDNEDVEENLMDLLQSKKDFWLKEQKKWWDALTDGQRNALTQKGMDVIEGYFNLNLNFYQQYFLEELEIYRKIFEELTLLTQRLKFYRKERVEG